MERDFLGLATKSSTPAIKQETNDAYSDSVAQRGTGQQWYFPDSVLNSPPVVSSKCRPGEKQMRSIFDPVQSPRYATALTTDNYSRRNMMHNQSGNQIALASSSLEQSGAQPVHHPEILKLHSFANNQNKTKSSAINCAFLQSHTFPAEQHKGRSTSNSPSFGCVRPVSPTSRVPSPGRFPTYTDMRSSSKPQTRRAQITIFYSGSVSVYDNISPEKAQAIMLLAGNGTSSTPASRVPSPQLQEPFTKSPSHDVVCIGNPSRKISSSMSHGSILSHKEPQCGGLSNQKTIPSPQQQPDPSQVICSQRSLIRHAITVPQARKASLARFLERRKERVTYTRPYPVERISSERECNMSSASDGLSFTLNSPS